MAPFCAWIAARAGGSLRRVRASPGRSPGNTRCGDHTTCDFFTGTSSRRLSVRKIRVRTTIWTRAPSRDSFGLPAITPVAVAVPAARRYAAAKRVESIPRRDSGVSSEYMAP